MKARVLVLFAFALVLSTSSAAGQVVPEPANAISLDGVQLQLGQSRDQVFAYLGNCCLLRKFGTGDDWSVKSKGADTEDYGQVSFSNGKLALVSKDWATGGEDAFTFVQTLHGALEQLGKGVEDTCSVYTNNTRTTVVEYRTITLSCGAKKLVVETSQFFAGEYKGTESTTIQELLLSAGIQ